MQHSSPTQPDERSTPSRRMCTHLSKILALTLALAGTSACGGARPGSAAPASPRAATTAPSGTPARRDGLQIKLTTVHVDDQEKALRFYTEVLGFAKKEDVSNGGYRWLTVAAPADPQGTALQLALNDAPAAKAYQQARFQQSEPAIMFFSDDLQADYERIKRRGGVFTMPPTEVMPGSTIATVNDTCGNLVQITQLTSEAP